MSNSPQTRPSLLIRLRDPRDERAWEEFVAIYTPVVDRVARSRGLQDADVADLTQDVFRAVAGAIERWDPDPALGSFRGWLFRIARNLAINLLSSRRRQVQGSGDSDILDALHQLPSPEAEDTIVFDTEYRRSLFHRAASQIRGQFRDSTWQAFWLTSVEGREAATVARELQLSVGAVYIARSRVMARLRLVIEQIEGNPVA